MLEFLDKLERTGTLADLGEQHLTRRVVRLHYDRLAIDPHPILTGARHVLATLGELKNVDFRFKDFRTIHFC
jgi:hypothetical protein